MQLRFELGQTNVWRPFTVLQAYGLATLQPDTWADSTSNAGQIARTPGNERGPLSPGVHDEPDPLGLYRGGVLA